MKEQTPMWRTLLPRLALMLGGLGCAACAIFTIFQLFPDLRPGGQRFIFTDLDGDTFRHQPGFVRPPEENRELENFIRRTDDDGFRLPRKTADFYPIIALGDSFTEGGEVPWVDVLAEELDTPVRNLGWRGWGPLQEAEVMRQYGGSDHDWVLIAYFEGNDLSNIQTAFQQLDTTGELDIERRAEVGTTSPTPVAVEDDNYLYPLTHTAGERTFELAYISDYLWWLNGPIELYQESRNIDLLSEALGDIKALAQDACVGLVYIPTKEHIYFPYADPEGNRRYVLENGLALRLDPFDWLSFGSLAPQEYDEVRANFDNQRMVVQHVTEEAGLHFIDLTPAFEGAVLTGDPTYYPYDSHWSQRGHDLAGKTVAEALRNIRGCSS
jgi:hypothetical protein